ncbi:MAG: hypothetical protein WC832_01515 [Anaerolineales bacterium]
MIHAVIDFSNIVSDPEALVISDNQSYLLTYSVLCELNLPQDEARIILKRKIYWIWFERLLNRLPEEFYSVEEASLLNILKSKWSCSIPNTLSDEIIKECGFLDFEELPVPGETFDDFVLRVSYGAIMGRKSITIDDIPSLCEMSKSNLWQESNSHDFLKSLLIFRLNLWQSSADRDLSILLEKFIKSPSAFYAEMISYATLKFYKTIGIQLLPDFQAYDCMNLPLEKLKFADNDIPKIIHQIEYEINTWEIPKTQDSLKEFILKISGRLELEYYKIEELLEKCPELLNEEIVDLIKEKFRFLPIVYQRIESLEKGIPPPFPSSPDRDWTDKKMMEWAITEYFPYYQWVLYTSKKFNPLEPLSIIFSDWFYSNFEEIKYNSKRMLSNFVPNNFEEFSDEKKINVVLIVDNLPYFFSEVINKILIKNGYSCLSISAYFAHPPTLTEFSKKCLVSGKPNYIEITDPRYKQLLEEGGWIPFKETLRLKYYPTIGAFYQETKPENTTYFINYLQLDELFHKTEEDLGVSHLQAAENILETLINKLVNYINIISKKKNVRLHIISDHGATFLEPTEKALMTREFIKLKNLQNYSFRYAELPGDPKELLTPDLVTNTYQIAKDYFGIPDNFLLARGFKTLIPFKGHRMSHGGLQPEEVIVPHMVFEKVITAFLLPTIDQRRSKYHYAKEEISLIVGNPNKEEMTKIYVSILNSNCESEKSTILLKSISPKTKVETSFIGRFKQTSNQFEKENLNILIRYEVKGNQFNYEFNLPIVMIQIVETNDKGIFDNF